jgi:hypothetical protein
VKVQRASGEVFFQSLIVDIEIKRVNIFLPFIGYCDAGSLPKRHGEKTVQSLIWSD